MMGTIPEIDNKILKEFLNNLSDGVYFVDNNRTITLWNESAKKISGFTAEEIMGKSCCDNILIHIDDKGETQCNSACPIMEAINTGKTFESKQLYLNHKNGHRIPVSVRVVPIWDSSNQIIGAAEIFNDLSAKISALEKIEELKKLILFDTLTEIGNRKYIDMNLYTRFAELERYNMPFGILFIDLDDFKKINDKYGHEIGDRVLKMTAQTMIKNIRPFDIIGRWGGEEFIAIFVNVNEEQLISIANKLRLLVGESVLTTPSQIIRTTVSMGATLAKKDDKIETIIGRTDQLMYKSKNAGKNRVTLG
ncbi:MAG: sensor domain-containing diguanylate cyclase [Endomicrobiales bacterium]|nr:sensor domain-containing diguanylate cyclase [Endomicrobiales bacterium]